MYTQANVWYMYILVICLIGWLFAVSTVAISAIFWQVYPGLMLTSASVHWILNTLNITVHIRDVCVFLAPMFRSVALSDLTDYNYLNILESDWF